MKQFLLATLLLATSAVLALADEVAVMKIKMGTDKALKTVVIDLYEDSAPVTAENFRKLARKGFYKKIEIHRAFPGLLVQTGDPTSRKRSRAQVGTGGPGYTLPAEINRKTGKGTLAMGRLPDELNPARRSNGSQFFITLQPMSEYDGKYTVFGEVIGGLDVVESISRESTDSNDYPVKTIQIRSLKIMPRDKVTIEAPAAG